MALKSRKQKREKQRKNLKLQAEFIKSVLLKNQQDI